MRKGGGGRGGDSMRVVMAKVLEHDEADWSVRRRRGEVGDVDRVRSGRRGEGRARWWCSERVSSIFTSLSA